MVERIKKGVKKYKIKKYNIKPILKMNKAKLMKGEEYFMFRERIKSDRGDNNTISNIFWIALGILIVTLVGTKLKKSIDKTATKQADCIENASLKFDSETGNNCE